MKTRRLLNLEGHRYGSLVVLKYAGVSPGKAKCALWLCRCECGVEKTFYSNALRSGGTSSCGCKKASRVSAARTTHGKSNSGEFNTWRSMISRTTNVKDPFYEIYGGRGITVCDKWKNSFIAFFEDMGPRPEGKTLDRIDNDKGYSPENCRWATKEEQSFNRRSTIKLTLNGEQVSRKEAARKLGIHVNTLRYWLLKGLTPDQVTIVRKQGGISTVEGSLAC